MDAHLQNLMWGQEQLANALGLETEVKDALYRSEPLADPDGARGLCSFNEDEPEEEELP